jgi:hypothetical protein
LHPDGIPQNLQVRLDVLKVIPVLPPKNSVDSAQTRDVKTTTASLGMFSQIRVGNGSDKTPPMLPPKNPDLRAPKK